MSDKKEKKDLPASVRKIVLVTGLSGAGLSTALKVFEDMGYEAVDNLRLGLVRALVDAATEGHGLAVAIDTRNVNFSVQAILDLYAELAARPELAVKLVFLDSTADVLQRRFTETRRRHPMAVDRPVTDGIRREREMTSRLRDEADQVIDTSALSIHDLRRLIGGSFRLEQDSGLSIFVTSFSFRQGLPREADLVFDVRFLANPHWDPALRPLTGQMPEVAAYIMKDEYYQPFIDHLEALLVPLMPRYQQEGKSYLTIAMGCTGGRHRSVLVAEQCATFLAKKGYIVGIGHRDMDRPASKAAG